MVLSGQRPAAQIAKELGISAHLLYEWKKALQADLMAASSPSPDLEKELKRLQRENAELREERDFLKKAAADSTDQCNTSFSLLAGVLYCKVFLGRWFSRSAMRFKYA